MYNIHPLRFHATGDRARLPHSRGLKQPDLVVSAQSGTPLPRTVRISEERARSLATPSLSLAQGNGCPRSSPTFTQV